jgi:hypothetical protein
MEILGDSSLSFHINMNVAGSGNALGLVPEGDIRQTIKVN